MSLDSHEELVYTTLDLLYLILPILRPKSQQVKIRCSRDILKPCNQSRGTSRFKTAELRLPCVRHRGLRHFSAVSGTLAKGSGKVVCLPLQHCGGEDEFNPFKCRVSYGLGSNI